tara:strand:- start:16109 stop:16300 length:192 start_codon:yes stop_codon:yes gene_type:complete
MGKTIRELSAESGRTPVEWMLLESGLCELSDNNQQLLTDYGEVSKEVQALSVLIGRYIIEETA